MVQLRMILGEAPLAPEQCPTHCPTCHTALDLADRCRHATACQQRYPIKARIARHSIIGEATSRAWRQAMQFTAFPKVLVSKEAQIHPNKPEKHHRDDVTITRSMAQDNAVTHVDVTIRTAANAEAQLTFPDPRKSTECEMASIQEQVNALVGAEQGNLQLASQD